jgi:5-methylthioadenosine/S-adenosylhomocysteine deaminase
MSKADLIIENGTILTMDPQRRIIDSGSVAIRDGEISSIGPSDSLKETDACERIDAQGGIVMPGLINTHTHAAMTIFRGFADDLHLKEWLEEHIWPAEERFVTPENVRIGTRLAIAEMIRSGTTTFNDMYFFEDEVAAEASKAGIRAVVGEVLLDFPTPSIKDPKDSMKITEDLINKWKGNPLIKVAVAPHSPYACSPAILRESKKLSEKHRIPMHTHLSETEKELEEMQKRSGNSPVEHLESLDILGPRVIAAHCVHLSDRDMDIISKRGVGVSHNPESNMKLASGVAPIPDLLESGVPVGLGTDGAASNNDLNMFEEMGTAARLHKVFRKDPTVLDARTVVEMATINGARSLGLHDRIGSLEVGKKADIIIIDHNKVHTTPIYNPYSHIVYSITGHDVETVIINGRVVMRNRSLLTLDEKEAIERVRELSKSISSSR